MALRLTCALLIITAPVAAAEPVLRTISLTQALQRALAANPRLTAAERDIGIATGHRCRPVQFQIPKHRLSWITLWVLGAIRGTKSAETTLQLGQLVELGGKRDARIAIGTAEVESARWQRAALRLEILSEAATAFFNILGAQRAE